MAFLGLCKGRRAGLAGKLLETMEREGVETDAMMYRVLMLLTISQGPYLVLCTKFCVLYSMKCVLRTMCRELIYCELCTAY